MTSPLAESLGITTRQLDYWCRLGLIQHQMTTRGRDARPVHADGAMQGHARVITAAEQQVIRTAGRLVRDGLSPAAAFRVARELAERGLSTLGGLTLRSEDA